MKKPWPTEEASNFKVFGALLSTKMKYYIYGVLFSHPSLGICFYILLEKEYQPRPVFGLTQSGWSWAFKVEQTQNRHSTNCFQAHKALYLLLHCMCRPRLQEAGGETHFPVVHQLQNSTTASNGVTQLKKKSRRRSKKNSSLLSQEPKHLQLRFCTKKPNWKHLQSKLSKERAQTKWSARKSPCSTWLGQ